MRIGIRTYEGRDVQKIFFQESPFLDNRIYPNEKIVPLKNQGTIQVRILNPKLFPQTYRVDIAMHPLDMDVHLGGIANAAMFNITHPTSIPRYLEYGNMTVTDFDFGVKVFGHDQESTTINSAQEFSQ
ncbi:MAG: hypothetical protein K6T94_26390 [Paenibacillus sp.]|nr:hypothetical protein [Paenibacillus sp.]